MPRLPRPVYIAFRVIEMFGLLASQTINAILGGSTRQRFSARVHVEQWPIRHLINAVFFWQEDHCKAAWEREIEDARKVLRRAGLGD
jgi:hypothetical protein